MSPVGLRRTKIRGCLRVSVDEISRYEKKLKTEIDEF
jgi:hypothetical protein